MKKIIILGALFLGTIVLAGCGQQQANQNQQSQNQAQKSPATTSQTTPTEKPSFTNNAEATDYSPVIDPKNFTTTIDNKYFSMKPGTVMTYEGTKDGEYQKTIVTVTNETKVIMGVTCVVSTDIVYDKSGQVVEDTADWFAQDTDGNVWYFGEALKDYENGKLSSTDGSWEAGVKGALPGLIMKANPQVGESWKQEYWKGQAEDKAQVLGINESTIVNGKTYTGCVKTKDWSGLEQGIFENKFYCPGDAANVVYALTVEGGSEYSNLVSITKK